MVSLRASIVIAPANTSRGSGFQIAHFLVRGADVINVCKRDKIIASLSRAIKWVVQHYPAAELRSIREDSQGEVAGFCFECEPSCLQNHSPRRKRRASRVR
jgi:hypothetical protein